MALYVLVFVLMAVPTLAAAESTAYAGSAADLLNPDKLFDALKKNITIPIPAFEEGEKGQDVQVPTAKETLEKVSPELQEVNKGIREETGVDFAKFISWSAKILKLFFQTVVDLLETVSKAMQGN